MRLLVLIELAAVVVILVLLVGQVVVPVIHGTPMFPILRRKPKEMEREIAEAREDVSLSEATRTLNELRAKANPKSESKGRKRQNA